MCDGGIIKNFKRVHPGYYLNEVSTAPQFISERMRDFYEKEIKRHSGSEKAHVEISFFGGMDFYYDGLLVYSLKHSKSVEEKFFEDYEFFKRLKEVVDDDVLSEAFEIVFKNAKDVARALSFYEGMDEEKEEEEIIKRLLYFIKFLGRGDLYLRLVKDGPSEDLLRETFPDCFQGENEEDAGFELQFFGQIGVDSKIDSSVSTFYEWFCGVRKGLIFLDVEGDLERRLTMDDGYVLEKAEGNLRKMAGVLATYYRKRILLSLSRSFTNLFQIHNKDYYPVKIKEGVPEDFPREYLKYFFILGFGKKEMREKIERMSSYTPLLTRTEGDPMREYFFGVLRILFGVYLFNVMNVFCYFEAQKIKHEKIVKFVSRVLDILLVVGIAINALAALQRMFGGASRKSVKEMSGKSLVDDPRMKEAIGSYLDNKKYPEKWLTKVTS